MQPFRKGCLSFECVLFNTVQRLILSKGAKNQQYFTISQYFCNIVGIKPLHGVKTCIGMIQVYTVWSLNVSASQTLRHKFSLFEFPLLKLCLSVCEN